MKAKFSYLVSADGWPMKYIRANTAAEARRRWQKMTGGPKNPAVSQVLGKKPKREGGE